MLYNIVIILLLILIWCSYPNTNRQLAATASAIRDIWLGKCGVTCRQNVAHITKPEPPTTSRSRTGPSSACVCEYCACDLIENFLGTCAPATNAYTHYINLLADYYYNFLKTITDMYGNLSRALVSGPSGRQAQLCHSQEAFRFPVMASKEDNNITGELEVSDTDSHDTLKSGQSISESSSRCSQCIEKDKLCISECPTASK